MSDVQLVNGQEAVATHVENFIEGIVRTVARSMEASSERLEIEAELTRFRYRMKAYQAVLKSIQEQRDAVIAEMEAANEEYQKVFFTQQIQLLDHQLHRVLLNSGLNPNVAQQSVQALTADGKPLYVHDGKRFKKLSLAV